MCSARLRPAADPRDALEAFFQTPWQFYFVEELSRLGEILRENGMYDWSRAPRLYFILRGVGQQHLISALLEKGITDASIPIEHSVLLSTSLVASPEVIDGFLRYQQQIVSHAKSVQGFR